MLDLDLILDPDYRDPDRLPPEWFMIWDERAAIMEYDGRIPRERAEALALSEILGLMRAAGPGSGR